MNRSELASFLRARRAKISPDEAGLPSGQRRHTPGLRRQEVAQLAGISIDYYIRLEQGRSPHPSKQVLAALSRALMLTVDEREYLFRMAGESPPPVAGLIREVSPGTRYLLDSLTETPAYLVDAKYDLLAWNRLATKFIGDQSQIPDDNRNMIRWMFCRPSTDSRWKDPDTLSFTRSSIADLRASYARYPGDLGMAALVTELLALSPVFAKMWAEHEVQARTRMMKRVEHPEGGPMEFECQVLHVSATDQRLIVYCAEPGSPTQAAFRRLAADLTPVVQG